jgi:hypothetical protein
MTGPLRADAGDRLFFFSAGGFDALRSIESFSRRPWLTRSFRPFGSVYRTLVHLGQEEVRVWGFRDTRSTRRAWAGLKAGDVGLGYAAGLFRVVSKLRMTAYSPELGRQLFGDLGAGDGFPLLAFFDGTESAQIARSEIAVTLGYSEGFAPRRGLFVPSQHRQAFLREAYGTPERFVAAVAGGHATDQLPPPEPLRPPSARRSAPPDELEQALPGEDFPVDAPPLAEERELVATTYARLDAPDVVTIDVRFPVTVGLAPEPGSYFGSILDTDALRTESLFEVQLVADGFQLEPGTRWKTSLRITEQEPYPSEKLLLRPTPELAHGVGVVQALFSTAGRTIGLAARVVRVRKPDDPDPPAPPPQFAGGKIAIPDGPAPDLTVQITRSASSDSRLLWTFTSPLDIELPDAAAESSVGQRPEAFAREVLRRIPEREGKPDLALTIRGVGVTVRGAMPGGFWQVIERVHEAVGDRKPTVLLLSEEPHVPWELASVDRPRFRDAPPFLAAQTAIGRWVLEPNSTRVAPPYRAEPRPFAVVVGRYRGSAELPGAVDEAAQLCARYNAVKIRARLRELVACLGGRPPSRILHFAIHGVHGPGTARDGLYLEDREYLQPFAIKGAAPLDHVPLVFLNACEVGTGSEWLGAYAGTAEAFVSAGATAVVAPLWAIDDEQAGSIALSFYERAFAGEPIAEILADVRKAFDDNAKVATPLAYQFFGHPLLRFD